MYGFYEVYCFLSSFVYQLIFLAHMNNIHQAETIKRGIFMLMNLLERGWGDIYCWVIGFD